MNCTKESTTAAHDAHLVVAVQLEDAALELRGALRHVLGPKQRLQLLLPAVSRTPRRWEVCASAKRNWMRP